MCCRRTMVCDDPMHICIFVSYFGGSSFEEAAKIGMTDHCSNEKWLNTITMRNV
jgi:hypothetical protein